MKTIFAFLLAHLSVSAFADDYLLGADCGAGKIKKGWSIQDVKDTFPEADYLFRDEHIGEGEYQKMLIVYPNTKNEMSLGFDPETLKLEHARIRGEGSQWHTSDGIKIGTSMAEVEKLNKSSFHVYGWGWDYGGQTDNASEKYTFKEIKFWFTSPDLIDDKFVGDKTIDTKDIPVKDKSEVTVIRIDTCI